MPPEENETRGEVAVYKHLLHQIHEQQKEYGETVRAPCSLDQLLKLQAETKTILEIDLPVEYSAFLEITDGLVWNGLCVLASQRSLISTPQVGVWIDGFIERNIEERQWDDRMCDYVVFAEDGEVSFAQPFTAL
jgi:hypothetical protein